MAINYEAPAWDDDTKFKIDGDGSYDIMNTRGEFEDIRVGGQNYIVYNVNYPSMNIADERSITEELSIKFDSMTDYLNYGRWQPLAGMMRFYNTRIMSYEPGSSSEELRTCEKWYTKYYTNGIGMGYYERYAPWEVFPYETSYRPGIPGTLYFKFADVCEFAIKLDSIDIQREGPPKPNGQIYATVTRKWTIPLLDTDLDGKELTPVTPPWMYRVDNVRVSSEAVEEAIEQVYPDKTYAGAWNDTLEETVQNGLTETEKYRYKIATARKKLDELLAYYYKIWKDSHFEKGEIEEYYHTQCKQAKKEFEEACHKAKKEYDIAKAAGESGESSGVIFNDDDTITTTDITIPFANSAGVMMEGTKSRFLLKIDFSYNSPYFDFSAPSRYKNKVNDKEIDILGVTYKPRSVLLNDIGAEFKREYKEDGTIKWEYWTINISLTCDERTFNREYANIGQHVRETLYYAVKEDNDNTSEDNCEMAETIYRCGVGKNKGMIVTKARYDQMKKDKIDTYGFTPINHLTQNPLLTDFAPRLDSYKEDQNEDGHEKVIYDGKKETVYRDDGTEVIFFPDDKEKKYTVKKRSKLSRIYQDNGHYYTRYQHGLSRPGNEMEEIEEPMFLSRDGKKLSPFMENGKQIPVYLKGCVYEEIDFSALGIPEVA